MKFDISGLQERQAENLRDVRAVQESGGLGRAVQLVALQAHREMVTETHVDTGALRASERVDKFAPARWEIYIEPGAFNPRSLEMVSDYAEVENDRGLPHDFIELTMAGADVYIERAVHYLLSEIP